METRQCKMCGGHKPADEFYDSNKSSCKKCLSDKRRTWATNNRKKAAEYSRNWRARNPDKARAVGRANYHRHRDTQRNYMMKRRGIDATVDDVQRMIAEQGNNCAICGDTLHASPHTDHDHATGMLRGILCHFCNHGLGNFRDNIDSLRAAIAYLENAKRRHHKEGMMTAF
jgi:hypothetical protein